MAEALQIERRPVATELAAEFPGLALWSAEVGVVPGRSPRAVRDRLRTHADRWQGAQAVALRNQPIPWAYRVFFRHVGIDPDEQRTPIEAAVLSRLMDGGWRSRGIVDDALTLGLLESQVPLWALDAGLCSGGLGLRLSGSGEQLGSGIDAPYVASGRLVVCDAVGPVAVLFGDIAPDRGVSRQTRRALLFSVQVDGVPAIHVEEAFDVAAEVLSPSL